MLTCIVNFEILLTIIFFFTFTCRLYSRDTVRWKLTYNKLNRNMQKMDRNPLEHFQKDNLRVCSCSNQVLEVIKLEDVYWYLRFTEEQASCFAWPHEVCLRPLHRKNEEDKQDNQSSRGDTHANRYAVLYDKKGYLKFVRNVTYLYRWCL